MTAARKLLPDDWAVAGLRAIAADGVDRLSVEGLAKSMGVTKGSFYWHFDDRDALVVAAAEVWEQLATIEVIAQLDAVADPRDRLRRVFELSFGDEELGPTDTTLSARPDDPIIGPIVRRVTARRIAFLESLFAQLGYRPAVAGRRARLAYAAYLGHFLLDRASPTDPTFTKGRKAYLDELLDLMTD